MLRISIASERRFSSCSALIRALSSSSSLCLAHPLAISAKLVPVAPVVPVVPVVPVTSDLVMTLFTGFPPREGKSSSD